MKVVAYKEPGAIDREDALVDITLEKPIAKARDLLVEVKAVSVNPVDTKVRAGMAPPEGEWRVLGWDAAGVVREVGEAAEGFSPGDEVYYAGALGRSGTNAEFHLVDARIAALKPKSLDFANAAALPLTAITAWEALFDRLDVERPVPGAAPAALIDDPAVLDVNPFKRKSVSVHWEFMFTRSMFETADIGTQGAPLAEVAKFVDAGAIRSTRTETLDPIDAATLKRAHALSESGRAIGKIVLEGFVQ